MVSKMATFKSLKDLNVYLEKQITQTMQKEVAEAVKDEMVEQIDKVVYDAYEPYNLTGGDHHYHRTYKLKDKDNMKATMIDDNTLAVENVRKDEHTGRDVTPVIVDGGPYTWGKASGYTRDLDAEIGARDFIQGTREGLSRKKSHVKALKDALKKQGIKVED